MSILKQVMHYRRKVPLEGKVHGFRTLPVKWPDKARPKPTSSAARDNMFRFTKLFTKMLPYGIKIVDDNEGYWKFMAPKRWMVNYTAIWQKYPYVRARCADHYATVKKRFSVLYGDERKKIELVKE